MKTIGTKLALQVALVLILLGSAMLLRAEQEDSFSESAITVCNKGTVPVEVVVAIKKSDFPFRAPGTYYWRIEGTTVVPQDCTTVRDDEDPAYVAFGFTDSKGEWGSGKIAQVPDLGSVQRSMFGKEEKVLTGAAKPMCVRKDATLYASDDELSLDCAGVKVKSEDAKHGHGAFFPLTSALYFYPDSHNCGKPSVGELNFCPASVYDLNISPSGTDRELHATPGTESDAAAARDRRDTQSRPAGAVPASFGQGTRNTMFRGRKVVTRNDGGDRRWFYEDGSPVEQAYQLTGTVASPLFDYRPKAGATLSQVEIARLVPIVTALSQEVAKGPRGGRLTEQGQYLDFLQHDLPSMTCIVREYANDVGTVHFCANLLTLDLARAEVKETLVAIPCRADATCVISAGPPRAMDPTGVVTLWNQRLSVSLATTLSIWTTGRERGQAIVALLTEYANWQAKLGEPTPVTSVP